MGGPGPAGEDGTTGRPAGPDSVGNPPGEYVGRWGSNGTTVWRVCRRYEARGIPVRAASQDFPPGAGALGKLGLYKTPRTRIGMDPRVGPDPAKGGGPRVHGAEPRSGFARGDVVAASRQPGGTIRLSSGRPRCWNAMNGPGSGGNRGSGWSVWAKSPTCRPWSGPAGLSHEAGVGRLESIRHGTVHRWVGWRWGPSVGRPMTGPIFERPCFGIGPGGGGMSASTGLWTMDPVMGRPRPKRWAGIPCPGPRGSTRPSCGWGPPAEAVGGAARLG